MVRLLMVNLLIVLSSDAVLGKIACKCETYTTNW